MMSFIIQSKSLRLNLILLVLWVILISSNQVATAAENNETILQRIIGDFEKNGRILLPNTYSWIAIDQDIELSQQNYFASLISLVDYSLGETPHYGARSLANEVDLILRYRKAPNNFLSQRRKSEQLYYRRVIDTRNVWLFRIFGFEPEYPEKREESSYLHDYQYYRDIWLKASQKLEELKLNQADPTVIKVATDAVNDALRDWDCDGYRREMTVILQRYEFILKTDPEILWDNTELNFITSGGALWKKTNVEPYFYLNPSIDEIKIKSNSDIWYKIPYDNITVSDNPDEYTIVKIERPWFEPGIFFYNIWEWNNGFPLAKDFRISHGNGCSTTDYFSCLPEYLVVVKKNAFHSENDVKPSDVSNLFVIGLIGEPLPIVPIEMRSQSDETQTSDQIIRISQRDVIDRLRNGSF
ncbi:MAG: hypothetical protein ACXVC7_16555 [Bacteroidia bacterium]